MLLAPSFSLNGTVAQTSADGMSVDDLKTNKMFQPKPHQPLLMKITLVCFLTVLLGAGSLLAEEDVVALEKIMVTGALADEASSDGRLLDKIMVTGALSDEGDETLALEKIIVTGALADEDGEEITLEKIMVTGSLADEKRPKAQRRRLHR